jgi:hypothetical protein
MSIKDLPAGLVDSVKELLLYQEGMNEGKYLKYSDLLLQKARLLNDKDEDGKGLKPDSPQVKKLDKKIEKEMKKLGIEEDDQSAYQKFFKAALKKFGVSSPAELKGDKEKEFYNYIEKNWTKDESLDEAKKGKYKSPKANKIVQDTAKILKREKKEGFDTKEIEQFIKEFKKGIETEMYDDMEILSKRSIKLMDKLFMGMETMPREEIGQIIDKHDPELFDMMFGY